MVYEFKPKIDWNKGKALVWLLETLGLDQQDDVFTIYIGDDTTDEDAFDVFRSSQHRKGTAECKKMRVYLRENPKLILCARKTVIVSQVRELK